MSEITEPTLSDFRYWDPAAGPLALYCLSEIVQNLQPGIHIRKTWYTELYMVGAQ